MVGEAWNSWHVERPFAFVIDDLLAGLCLILSAESLRVETTRRRAFFASAWGINAGMLYTSFFEKIVKTGVEQAEATDPALDIWVFGAAFLVACFGTIAAIVLPRKNTHGL